MKRADAEKLLGGYAAGILSEAERSALFAAALEDQALFDALADEEALRELLEDPAARLQLLAALTRTPKVIPFWRRPAVLGAAASLLAAVGGSLLVHRSGSIIPPIASQRAVQARPEQQQTAKPPAPAAEAAKPVTTEPPKPEPPPAFAHLDRADRGAAAGVPAQNQPGQADLKAKKELGPEAMSDLSSAQGGGNQERDKAADARKMEETKPAPPPPPPTQAPAPAPAEARAKQEPKTQAQGAIAGGALGGVSGAVPGAGNFMTSGDAVHGAPLRKVQAQPTWTLDTRNRPFRLLVHWNGQGRIYLIKRSDSKASLLRASHKASFLAAGTEGFLFLVEMAEGESLDLYQLTEPVEQPEALPADGPIQGFRARVWPEQKKTP